MPIADPTWLVKVWYIILPLLVSFYQKVCLITLAVIIYVFIGFVMLTLNLSLPTHSRCSSVGFNKDVNKCYYLFIIGY